MPQQRSTDAGLRVATVADPAEEAVIGTDLNGSITVWSPGAQRLFGYTAAEVLGQPVASLCPSNRENEENGLLERLQRGETVEPFETIRQRKDGQPIPVMWAPTPLRDAEDALVGVSRHVKDLRGRRRAEPDALRLAAIVESSEDAIVGKNLDGIVFSWNRAAERIFGYTAEEMVGKSIRTIIPEERQTEEDEVIARIRAGLRVDHFETIRRRKDGTLIPISLTISPIRDEKGRIIGASKVARDITERKQADNERARLLAIAQEAGRLKDEFLATLSHELRTPLNAILGYTRMVRSGLVTGDREARAIETIERNAVSLTQIIEDVLDVSRIISGKIRLHVQPVDLRALIGEALETVRPAAEARGIRLEIDPAAAHPPVSGDPERLQQVLWNLLSNAVKFTGQGGMVRVKLRQRDGHVEISVRDTGEGIAHEFLPHVFERFRQADAGMTREHGGLGLGLAITRHLVEMHGGTVHVASEGRGKGATFSVKLPIMVAHPTADVAEEKQRTKRPATVAIAVPDLGGVTVLVVDDDADALMMVREILEATGARVITADSAAEALKVLDLNQPDVLLADVGMPHVSGFELIRRVRQSPNPRIRNIPAAALTAYARSEDRINSLRSGFQRHMSKPIDPSELMGAIAALAHR